MNNTFLGENLQELKFHLEKGGVTDPIFVFQEKCNDIPFPQLFI